jgi:hypothetical protein
MILIKFVRKGIHYTWFINENWIATFVFLIVLLGGLTVRTFWPKKRKITDRMLPPRGGTNIIDCLEPEKTYELVDDAVKLAFRQNFNEGATRGTGPVIIKAGVFIYSFIMANKQINNFLFSGLEIYITNIRDLALKTTSAATLAMALLTFFGTGVSASVLGSLVVAIIIAIASNNLNCSDFVRELPQTPIEIGTKYLPVQTAAVFLDEPQDLSNNRVFIVDNEETLIYVPQKTEYESCSEQITEEYLEVENTNPTIPWQRMYRKTAIVRRKCYSDRKYVPLKARTKTLADLKKDDVSKRREITEDYSKQYEKKRIENDRIDN